MGSLFSPKKPQRDEAAEKALAEREAEADAQEKQQQKKANAQLRALRGRSRGQRSLLSGLETGVTDDSKRSSLG